MRMENSGKSRGETLFCWLGAGLLLFFLTVLFSLFATVLYHGWPRLDWGFLTSLSSHRPEQAGILSALVGTAGLMLVTVGLAFPVGLGAAVYLEEYALRDRSNSKLIALMEINIANLAAVPSVVYGLLGLAIFVRWLELGSGLLTGGLTLALLILPTIIITSREALRSVPESVREASVALGATRLQTLRHQVLPAALPGILTGLILSFSRAIGETAPLLVIGVVAYVSFLPDSLFSPFTALPVQVFHWVTRAETGFHANAAAAIAILLPAVLFMNAFALWLRSRYEKSGYGE